MNPEPTLMRILSPAKINLFLQVTGKRPDGYHELFSLMCCVDLYDIIQLEFSGRDIQIKTNNAQIPLDVTNHAHKAATLFLNRLNRKDGLKISIEKNIPVAAGLGGGSSNAASVLLGLNRHYNFPLSRVDLMSMGRSIGADVPFFIFQKAAFATGIGEKLEAYEKPLPYCLLLIYPGIRVPTQEVYRNFNLRLTKCKKKLKKAPLKKSGFDASLHLCNDLESVTASNYPVINTIKEQLLKHGAVGALMSGSGPTVFGLFSDPGSARKAKDAFDPDIHVEIYLSKIIDKISFVDC
ncbi:MAG: 4-(cytidine 5'-diphospho)-2-C-methyl-D-erythritol kinase [Desulfobacterales bacterium]|jgi:4-diphosphocytidyl-2-C-methyl-D-erythritol kinase